jgi:hypothetical protein
MNRSAVGRRSKRRGKSYELKAVHYLRKLGFPSARRTQQFSGKEGASDVVCEELDKIHIEVKANRSIDLGTVALYGALEQALEDGFAKEHQVVLWWKDRQGWRLSWYGAGMAAVTVAGDSDVAVTLGRFQNGLHNG